MNGLARSEEKVLSISEIKEAGGQYCARFYTDLNRIDGFISIERFQSLSDPEKLLSLSLMRKLSRKWRNHSNIAKAK